MSARQLIVLVVAAIAAIGALFVIRGMGARGETPEAAETATIAGEQVLVAARDVPQGAALTPSDLAVVLFPADSVSQSFVRLSAQPSAQADLVGAVTRRPFAQGEPITLGSVVQPDGRGFMAAQLAPGFRAVSIEIEAQSAAGGYIQPNDRVDVLVTTRIDTPAGGEQVNSNIILEDVRVLALGETTQTQTGGEAPVVIQAGVAVLELTAEDSRVLALANEMGEISLALRGVQVETVGMAHPGGRVPAQQSGSVRIHAFGNVTGGSQ
ncbi:MAG: Flp pilus assembly protein CpaB [Hyphomonadaceae bacterium]|nr:Flp pilus assembly protein CpaB [Hyphomonadaceae bacterium]